MSSIDAACKLVAVDGPRMSQRCTTFGTACPKHLQEMGSYAVRFDFVRAYCLPTSSDFSKRFWF